jgi:LPS-assembly lipoprotein
MSFRSYRWSLFLPLTPHPSRLTAVVLCMALTACGFHLRGQAALPFDSVYIEAAAGSQFANQLGRAIRSGSETKVVNDAKNAQATLQIISESRERQILSLSASGRVQELTLLYRVAFRLGDGKGKEYMPPNEVLLRRDLTYSDADVIAKEQEEVLLYRDMEKDAVQQVMRRLQAVQIGS